MTQSWNEIGWGPWPPSTRLPQEPPAEDVRRRLQLPVSLRPASGPGVVQRPVFDPALLHYVRAMRAGDPQFEDPRVGARWYAARRTACDHVITAIAGSVWRDHLVLRGSLLLAAWLGPAAREPGDLDFVVLPRTLKAEDGKADRMLEELIRLAEDASTGTPVEIRGGGAVEESIWTYDRVPGRRLVLPWRAEGLPSGQVQLDFVFGEHVVMLPEPVRVPRVDGRPSPVVFGATPELSLAWKLLWLITDMHPQAKDLYDAALLAQVTDLEPRLLREVLAEAWTAPPPYGELTRAVREVEWEEFVKEYPALSVEPEELERKLLENVAEAFAGAEELSGDAYAQKVERLAPALERCRRLPAEERADALKGVPLLDAAVIRNELLGRTRADIDASFWEVVNGAGVDPAFYLKNTLLMQECLGPLRG